MRIFGHDIAIQIRKASKKEVANVTSYNSGYRPAFLQSRSRPMLLSAVYRCVDLISSSVAVLPLETYKLDAEGFKARYTDHPAYYILNSEPNEHMTRFTFFKTLMASVLLNGNGYAYIERDSALRPEQLVFLPPAAVSIEWITDRYGIRRKRYRVVGFSSLVEPRDMIHVLNFSYDGITGISTLSHARQTLGIASDSEEQAANFLRSGANSHGILKVEGPPMKKEQKDEIYNTWDRRMSDTGRHNSITIIEGNMSYQPISISPKDSQLLESRQFNVVDICRFFSVSPVKAFDLTKSSYRTVEATQLDYLNDTALSVIVKIEQEINRKVFLPSERGKVIAEFDTSVLLRTDKSAQADYWQKMFYIGAATPNEVRREVNFSRLENGDNAFVQVNVQPLDRAIAQPVEPPQGQGSAVSAPPGNETGEEGEKMSDN